MEKEIEEKIDVKITDVGEVLELIADEDNPVSDGREFKE